MILCQVYRWLILGIATLTVLAVSAGSNSAALENVERISVGSSNVTAGGTTSVPIQVTGIRTDIAAATVRLTFNPAIVTVKAVNAGNLGAPISNINNATGIVAISAYTTSAVPAGNTATIANVVLQGVTGAEAGATSPLTLTVQDLYDSNFVNRPDAAINSGTLTIVTVTGGDLLSRYDTSHNGRIDKNEAVLAVTDYFSNTLTKQEAINVVNMYFTG